MKYTVDENLRKLELYFGNKGGVFYQVLLSANDDDGNKVFDNMIQNFNKTFPQQASDIVSALNFLREQVLKEDQCAISAIEKAKNASLEKSALNHAANVERGI